MRRNVTVVTPPAAEPVTLDEVKTFAKIDGSDEDALLASFITAAVEHSELYLKRSLITQTLKITLDQPCDNSLNDLPDGVYDMPATEMYGSLPRSIELPRCPIQSVSSIVTYDTANASSTYSSDNYQVDTAGGRVFLNSTAFWPSNIRPVAGTEITYVAGYGDTSTNVPQPIKTAILMHVQRMYDMRIVCDMPTECERLLQAHRIYG